MSKDKDHLIETIAKAIDPAAEWLCKSMRTEGFSGEPQIPCGGRYAIEDGKLTVAGLYCGEPCDFVMQQDVRNAVEAAIRVVEVLKETK